MQTPDRVIESGTALRQFLDCADELLVDMRLLPGEDIDIGPFEVVEQFLLEPALAACQEPLGDVEIVVGQARAAICPGQDGLHRFQQRGTGTSSRNSALLLDQ